MMIQDSPYISVTTTDLFCTKMAPGMSNQYLVNFCATDYNDYKLEITFVTDEMSAIVPIFGIDN